MSKRSRITTDLPAGIIDAAFASLATFAIGLAAVNLLDNTGRGVYAIYFTTFMLATVLPRYLIFTPAEVDAVSFPEADRIGLISRTIKLGAGPAAVGATAVGLAALVAAPVADTRTIVAFTVTTAATSLLSPIQDHVRKMLHIAARSWLAAVVSIVQFATAGVALFVMWTAGTPHPWVPFGALAVANLVSLASGWVLTLRAHRQIAGAGRINLRDLLSRGRWLVAQAAVPSATGFVAAALITHLAGADALGFAESARVVSQPILVFATGLTAVLAPRTMEAAMKRDLSSARRASAVYLRAVSIAGIAYLLIAGWDWTINPMQHLVPSAYEMSGLVALTIVANFAGAATYLQINELLGARREPTLAHLAWVLSPILLLGAATAGITEAFARAIGRLGESVARFLVQRRVTGALYDPATRR